MTDEHRIRRVGVELTVGLVRDLDLGELLSAGQHQRVVRCEEDDPLLRSALVHALLASAWSRSEMMSSTCSIPIDSRTMSSGTPAASSSSGVSCECVVGAVCVASGLLSP